MIRQFRLKSFDIYSVYVRLCTLNRNSVEAAMVEVATLYLIQI